MPRFHRLVATGKQRHTNDMNKTEKAYNDHLELLKTAGEIHRFWFHALNLKLAPKCFYQTDFLVQLPTGELQIHEVKGFMQDAALIKLKIAAQEHAFRVFVIKKVAKKDGGGWSSQEIGAAEVIEQDVV